MPCLFAPPASILSIGEGLAALQASDAPVALQFATERLARTLALQHRRSRRRRRATCATRWRAANPV